MRKIAAVLLSLFFCLTLNSFAARTTIRYLTFETSYQQISLIKKIIAEFEKRNPDIHVQLEATTEASRVFLTEMAAGSPPEVMYIGSEMLPQMVGKHALIPMNDWISRDSVDMSLFFPKIVKSLTFDDKIYAYPIHYSTNALFYNKKLFDEKGVSYPDENWTWDDYRNAAMKLTIDRNGDGKPEVWGCLTPDSQVLIRSFGGKICSDDTSKIIVNNPGALNAIKYLYSLLGKCAPLAAQVQDTNEMQLFTNDKVAMFLGRTWQLPQIIKTMPEDSPWDIAPTPKGVIRFSAIGVGGNCIARGCKNPEAAWKFVKFYSSLEGQKLLGVQKNCAPALIELCSSPQYFLSAPPQSIKVFLDAAEYSDRPLPDSDWSNEFSSRVWEPVMEQIRTQTITPENAVKQWEKSGNAYLDKWRQEVEIRKKADFTGDTTAFLFRFMMILMVVGLMVVIWFARTNKKYWEGYLFIAPWIIGFIIFTLGPVMASLYLSFTKYDMLSMPQWVGIMNFTDLFKDKLYLTSLYNTFYYALFQVPASLIFALILAMLLNHKLKGIYTFRAIYYLPAITSGVAISLLWRWLFNPDLGLINSILGSLGIPGPGWLTSPTWAMPAIIIMSVWGGTGGAMLIYLAGLQGIPEQLYEAANLDGANNWQKFRNVTLPMLSPTIFFNLIMSIIGSFQVFVTIFVMTSNAGSSIEPGGPVNSTLVYVLYLYRIGFRYLNMGSACAMAWILFIIILALTMLNFWLSKRWVNYDQV